VNTLALGINRTPG